MLDRLEKTLHRWATALVNTLKAIRDYFKRLGKELKDVWTALKAKD